MNINIRNAKKEDCLRMMELINELAVFEKAPDEVTITLDHFTESGFGPNPVWQAFVATASPNAANGGEQAESTSSLPSPQSGEGEAENEAKIVAENAVISVAGYEKTFDVEEQMTSDATRHRPSLFRRGNEGEAVVGFALYYIRYSTWKGQRLYLEDLLVTESMRGKGIGKLLFDRLIEEGKNKKYSGMVWQVLDWNEPAINFYKKYNADIDSGWLNCSLNF